jgi:hypothetical protein
MKIVKERKDRVEVTRTGIDKRIRPPYEDVRVLTDDQGRTWRECLGPELDPAKLDPERLVWLGRGEPHKAGEYADYAFPGGHPFLHGLCMLGPPVYLEVEEASHESQV